MVPEYEFMAGGGMRRFKLNHLPAFLNDLYSGEGQIKRNDDTRNELFVEKSLWLEIHYESDGQHVVSECELLFKRWHEQIRTGQHKLKLGSYHPSRLQ